MTLLTKSPQDFSDSGGVMGVSLRNDLDYRVLIGDSVVARDCDA